MQHSYKQVDVDGTVECTKCGLRNSDISREDYIKCTPATSLMKLHPGMVEEVISMLRHMEIDGETMQHIIQSVGLEDQMTRQLMFLADRGYVEDLWEEIVELEKSHD
jgi:DNA-directed RNA polymerase subunit RPC12/RpoP